MTSMTSNRWTAASVAAYVAATANMDWATEGHDVYEARYVRPIAEFGLHIRLDQPEGSIHLTPPVAVPLQTITSSTQVEGVCLDVIDHYLVHPHRLLDRDGWFGNKRPVLLVQPDGTHTIRDGNHRCLAAMLRGDPDIHAHVVNLRRKAHATN